MASTDLRNAFKATTFQRIRCEFSWNHIKSKNNNHKLLFQYRLPINIRINSKQYKVLKAIKNDLCDYTFLALTKILFE